METHCPNLHREPAHRSLWFEATERLARIRGAEIDDGVFPIHADARALPFAAEFFHAIISIDSFVYYGTDDLYANCRAAAAVRRSPVEPAPLRSPEHTIYSRMLAPT